MAGQGKQWVLLAAGSTGWVHYRHQADVCHAYEMVHQHSIPDEQVVVMMYDDIANNTQNPFPGEIINQPGGPNVYPGVPKDYTGLDVTANNFLAVLRGDEAAVVKQEAGPKKVLKSGQNDMIFVYLSDHGGAGVFSFPSDTLHASDLLETINEMSEKKKFSKMVIYIESCRSGSMIHQLPGNIEVYGVSASKPDEKSYACWYDAQRSTCLADVFSAYWLHHCDTSDLTKTTFQSQFQFLKDSMKNSNASTPCQYGNMEITKLFISEFLVDPGARAQHKATRLAAGKPGTLNIKDAIPSHDVPLVVYKKQIQAETDPEKKAALQKDHDKLLETRAKIKEAMRKIAQHACPERGAKALEEKRPLTRLKDMKEVAEHFRKTFREWHEGQDVGFVLTQMQGFSNLFESGIDVAKIKDAITHVSSLQ